MTILRNVRLNGTVNLTPGYVPDGLFVYFDAGLTSSYPGTGIDVVNLRSATNPHRFGSTINPGGGAVYTLLNGIPTWDCTNTAGASIRPTTGSQAYSLLPATYTYCIWARLLSSTSNYRTLIRTTPDDHLLLINIGTNTLGYYDNNSNTFFSSGFNVSSFVDVWAQWTVTSTGTGNSTYYINGAQVGSSVSVGGGGNYHDSVGSLGNGQPFGYVANCLLYNRALTLAEITQNYQTFRGRFGV
jgi:hypothetical protein